MSQPKHHTKQYMVLGSLTTHKSPTNKQFCHTPVKVKVKVKVDTRVGLNITIPNTHPPTHPSGVSKQAQAKLSSC